MQYTLDPQYLAAHSASAHVCPSVCSSSLGLPPILAVSGLPFQFYSYRLRTFYLSFAVPYIHTEYWTLVSKSPMAHHQHEERYCMKAERVDAGLDRAIDVMMGYCTVRSSVHSSPCKIRICGSEERPILTAEPPSCSPTQHVKFRSAYVQY